MDEFEFEELLREVAEGVAECPKCGNTIELDGKCSCGGESRCRSMGII